MDEGCESMYLDRLRKGYDVKAHVETIEEELAEEMAQALGRTTSKCDYQFALLDRERKAYEAAADPEQRAEAAEAFEKQRLACVKARQDLLIHRQALGFKTKNHDVVDKFYPITELRRLDEAPEDVVDAAPWAKRQTYSKGRNWGGFRTF